MRIRRANPRRLDWMIEAERIADEYSEYYRKPVVTVSVGVRRALGKYPEVTYGQAIPNNKIRLLLGTSDDDVVPTIIHELAHLKAGLAHMHDKAWAKALVKITRDLGYSDELIEREISAGCTGHQTLAREYRGENLPSL